VLVVIVMIGRQRLHRWALWVPNLVIRLFGGSRPIAAVGGSDAP
jgi:branched-chain amino acid transport system permease protein